MLYLYKNIGYIFIMMQCIACFSLFFYYYFALDSDPGLDLSGSPLKNSFTDLESCFRMAKDSGLKSSIHCGEIPCKKGVDIETDDELMEFSYRDTKKILDFEPDRLGHALLFTDEMYEALERGKKIPSECCPTSNVMTLELAHISKETLYMD
jgi:adenosine deaminase